MDFPIQINTISMGLSIIYFKGSQVEITNHFVLLSEKIVFILANSGSPDEMAHFDRVFAVCQSTALGISSIQRDKNVVFIGCMGVSFQDFF